MPKMEPVLPSLTGQPRRAGVDVRPVRMPGAYDGLADAGNSLVRGIASIGGALADLKDREDDLDYRERMNAAIAEADRRMEQDVWSKTGSAADGSLERADRIYREVASKYTAGMSPERQRRFGIEWGARRNGQAVSVMRHARSEVLAGRINADKTLIGSETQNYLGTLDSGALERMKNAYDDLYRANNNESLLNRASLAAFDRDLADGDNSIKLPTGKVLRIVDADPKEGEITRRRLGEIRENLAKQVSVYESGLQNMYDSVHSQAVDRFLQDGRIGDAEEYVAEHSQEGAAHPLSPAAKELISEAVARHREAAEVSVKAAEAIRLVQSKGGAYGSADQEAVYANTQKKIAESYTGEKAGLGRRLAAALEYQYHVLVNQQKARAAADTVSAMKWMQDNGKDLSEREQWVAAMQESPVKTALQKANERARTAYNRQSDPVFLAGQERTLNDFKLQLAEGFAELDGIRYDFSDERQLKAYALNLGFTDAYAKRAADYIAASRSRIDAMQAAKVLAQLTEVEDPAEALRRYPTLLRELESRKGAEVIPGKEMDHWLKANISELLLNKVSLDRPIIWDGSDSRKVYVKDGKDPETLYMTEKQLREAYRRKLGRDALRAADPVAAAEQADIRANAATASELAAFARSQGYDRREGYYYLKGGK